MDSAQESPKHTYTENREYKVKLTVTDGNGNTDDVINSLRFEKEVPIEAVLLSSPAAGYDGSVYLSGTTGTVTLDFSKSLGKIAEYIIDKNIYFAGDQELKFTTAGSVSIYYDKSWGKTVTKLTVKDATGTTDSATLEIKFK
jgi:PKD repeat protein